jgi:hypothetical protein
MATGFDPCYASKKPGWEGGTDLDGDGLQDGLERSGYNTCAFVGDGVPAYGICVAPNDSDGGGCADTLEVMDINGDRKVTVGDQTLLAKRSVLIVPASDSDAIFDVNKDGKISIGDLTLMAKNTCIVQPSLLGCSTGICPAE